jgi:Fe-S-cluster containining protein
MCCNGTLYNYVTLRSQEEVDALLKYDPALPIITRSEQPTFDEPCRLHDGTGCTAYRDRPDTCSRYTCELLRAVDRDEVTDVEARLIIEEARALVENVREYVEVEPGKPLAVSTWLSLPGSTEPEARVAWERALLHLRRHFLGPDPDAPKPALAEATSD